MMWWLRAFIQTLLAMIFCFGFVAAISYATVFVVFWLFGDWGPVAMVLLFLCGSAAVWTYVTDESYLEDE